MTASLIIYDALGWARQRRKETKLRLKGCQRRPVGRGAADYPNQRQRSYDLALCHGRLEILDELIDGLTPYLLGLTQRKKGNGTQMESNEWIRYYKEQVKNERTQAAQQLNRMHLNSLHPAEMRANAAGLVDLASRLEVTHSQLQTAIGVGALTPSEVAQILEEG